MPDEPVIMDGVREYAEEMDVELRMIGERPCVSAQNEAGHNGTDVDLLDLLAWVKLHHPEWRTKDV